MRSARRGWRARWRVLPRTARSMASNSTAVLSAGTGVRALTFLVFLLLSRALGPADLGVFALVIAAVEVARHVTDMALGIATVRQLSSTRRGEWPALLGASLVGRLIAAMVGFAVVFLVGTHPALSNNQTLFAIAGLSLFTAATTATLTAPFQASLGMRRLVRPQLAVALGYLVTVVWGGSRGWGVPQFMVAFVAQEAALTVLTALAFARRYRIGFERLRERLRHLWREGSAIGILAVVVLLYYRLDIFMLEAMVGSRAVGEYAVAFRISEGFILLAVAVSASAFPRLNQLLAAGNRGEVERTLTVLYRGSIVGGSIVALVVSLTAPTVIPFLLPGFAQAGVLTAVLIWSFVFVFANHQTVDLMMAMGRTRVVTLIATGNLALNIGLNFALIPWYGAMGAVVATVATEGWNALIQSWYLQERVGYRLPMTTWGFAAIAAGAAFLARLYPPAALVLAIAAVTVVYRYRDRLLAGRRLATVEVD